MNPAFAQVDHRPWPVPASPWTWRQAWLDLLFVHFEVDAGDLRRLLPPELELDTHDGKAWVGIVPFRMTGVTKRGWPAPSLLCDFPEINVRTYVRHGGKPGVWFFSLDVRSGLIAWFARTFFHLPYHRAVIDLEGRDRVHHYVARRGANVFEADYRVGELAPSRPGSFGHWATERYCLYSQRRDGRCFRGEVQHPKWPLHRAELTIRRNTLSPLALGPQHPEVFFSPRVDVVVWPLVPIN